MTPSPLARFALSLFLALSASAASWKVQFFYDRDDSKVAINDFQFVNASTGFAAGIRTFRRSPSASAPFLISTTDGGKHWTELTPPMPPESIFFLNPTTGWMTSPNGIWRTTEGGHSWKLVSELKGVTRLWFLSETHGFAIGYPKLMKETNDGGATWTDVKAAQAVNSKPENTTFTAILFQGQSGIVSGISQPRRQNPGEPAWVDPEEASRRRLYPTLSIGVRTSDGGKTWSTDTAPVFGVTTRLRINDKIGMSIVRYAESFEVPTEVYGIGATGKIQTLYKQKGRIVTDAGWLGSDTILVMVESPQKMNQLPFPGKVHVLRSLDLTTWTEMDVSYKAFGGNAMLAVAGENKAWIATDTGMILELVP